MLRGSVARPVGLVESHLGEERFLPMRGGVIEEKHPWIPVPAQLAAAQPAAGPPDAAAPAPPEKSNLKCN